MPILRADDLGAVRGDGIFETMHVRAGRPWLLEAHLARMVKSAARLDLALPSAEALAELVGEAVTQWPEGVEGSLRLVCTRGPESGGAPTIFVIISPVPPATKAARENGVAVLTATLGLSTAVRGASPWLLGGAKTLSYAMNMASLRWAAASGGEDVLWVSSDGYALEAPTSTLVWLEGTTLSTVPIEETGILPGTTARYLLDNAAALGWTAGARMIKPAELLECDGAWLTSSVRGIAAVRSLDGIAMRYTAPQTAKVRDLLGF
jgi:4-amino-4-deoxychorismate lyase